MRLSGRGPLNLLGLESFRNLNTQLDQIAQAPKIRAVIITGTGESHFSAGVDLLELKELTPRNAETFVRTMHEALRKLLTLHVPVIASIQGQCLGGALGLVLACDLRVAAEDSKMGLPEVRAGIPSVIAFVHCFESPNAREAMEAFLEKRQPGFGGSRLSLSRSRMPGPTLEVNQARLRDRADVSR